MENEGEMRVMLTGGIHLGGFCQEIEDLGFATGSTGKFIWVNVRVLGGWLTISFQGG